MNELLAIIIIVIVCCAIFCAWLLSMATCPDKMVDWLNGTASNSTCSTSYESKELINKNDPEDPPELKSVECTSQGSSFFLQLGNITKTANSKKLSVVPEQDEQLTVTSISQILFPTIHKESVGTGNVEEGGIELASHFDTPQDTPTINGIQDDPASMGKTSVSQVQGTLSDLPIRYHYSAPAIHVV